MSKHAKVFWQSAVSLGLAMAIFQLFQGRIWAAAISGVAGGIVAGGGLAWLSYLGERKLAKQDIRTVNMDPVQERAVEVQYSTAVAFAASRAALLQIPRLRISQENKQAGEMEAHVGMTMRSFGEIVSVRVVSCGDNRSRVSIRNVPRMKTTKADYGKGIENLEVFLRQMRAALPASASVI
jgi:hypothetical protein